MKLFFKQLKYRVLFVIYVSKVKKCCDKLKCFNYLEANLGELNLGYRPTIKNQGSLITKVS